MAKGIRQTSQLPCSVILADSPRLSQESQVFGQLALREAIGWLYFLPYSAPFGSAKGTTQKLSKIMTHSHGGGVIEKIEHHNVYAPCLEIWWLTFYRTWTTGCIYYDLFRLPSTFNNLALPTPSIKNWCLVASPKLCATVDSLTEAHVIPRKSPSICLQVRPWNLSFRSRCWSQQLRTRVLQAGNCLKAKTPRSWNNKRTIIWNINLYYFTIFLFYFLRLSPSNRK